MKKFILIIILILNLQSWTKADDIRDFEIEGMSIGDSLFDHFSESEFDIAKKLLNKSILIKPDHAEAHYNLGLIFAELKKFQKAINYYQKAIQIKPDHVGAYNNLGNTLKELGKFHKAIDCFQKAIQIKPDHE